MNVAVVVVHGDVANGTRVQYEIRFARPETNRVRGGLLNRTNLQGSIAYVAPSSWRIPELGFAGSGARREHGGIDELLHPTTHGNPLSYDEGRLSVLLGDAVTAGADLRGIDRFAGALAVRPIEFVELDIDAGELTLRRPAAEGYWAGIPVPTF